MKLTDPKSRWVFLLFWAFLFASSAYPQKQFSEWSQPVNLGCGTVNSTSNDFGPAISKDGLSLYLSSNRPGSLDANSDIYVAQRVSTSEPWGTPVNLGPTVNSTSADNNPTFSRDGHWMFFNSLRPSGLGDTDLWASYREHVHDDFAWQTPFNLGPGVNTTGFDAGPSYFENDEGRAPLLFFGRGVSASTQGTTTDIWVSELQLDGTFGNAHPVPELNSGTGDQRPSIRFDGLEIFFFSSRPGSVPIAGNVFSNDIWSATRKSVDDTWDAPVNLGTVVNTAFGEFNPQISGDGLTLYFTSNRPALDDSGNQIPGCGGFDLYMTTRTRTNAKDGSR
jgi:WD40-like Beta Propeller Repeat